MKNVTQFFFRAWRPAVLLLSLGLIAYLLFFHNLNHLLPGYDARELRAYNSASNWHSIVADPLNAPYKLAVLTAVVLGHHSILVTRIAAASFSLVAALVFFAIIRPWYGYRVAFLSTLLFSTSAGFLHVARLGSALILQMSILLFIGAILWYRRLADRRSLIGYGVVAALAVLWYVPGMIWFELFGVILMRGGAFRQLRDTPLIHKIVWAILFLAIIAPLARAGLHSPSILRGVAGLPQHFASLPHMGANIGNAVLSIGLRSPGDPELWVGHAPLLDIIELTLGAMGAYFYLRHERSVRTLFLTGSIVLALVLIGLGGPVSFSCLIPLLYLFVASGLNSLLSQWLTVFPRNPIARLTGVTLVCVMLFFSILYQVRSYFVAWPHTTAARHTFNLRQP